MKQNEQAYMSDEMFTELLISVKQAGAILRGEQSPSRVFIYPDVKQIREKVGLTQEEFAEQLNISKRTLENWEQKRRKPTGTAVTLLRLLDNRPDILQNINQLNFG